MEYDKSGMWLPKTGTPIEVIAVGQTYSENVSTIVSKNQHDAI